MADTASYAGAMKTSYPVFRKPAQKRGDRRPGSLKGGHPIGVHRSAAQKRLGQLAMKRKGTGSRDVRPTIKVNGNRSI